MPVHHSGDSILNLPQVLTATDERSAASAVIR